MALSVSIQAEGAPTRDRRHFQGYRRGAAVVKTNSRAISEGPGIRGQKQGKAVAVSGQTIEFQNSKLRQWIQGVLQCHSA